MEKLKIFELFTGIGSIRSALERLEIDYESLGYSEIDKFAIESYCTLYNDTKENNYGDITQIKKIPNCIDLLYHGSPCQDFSKAGTGKGGDVGSETRSSLMWETCRLVQESLPEIVIWENVKNVISKKHKHNFDKYIQFMENLGYSSSYKLLHGTDFNVPQTRPRIFVISTLINKSFIWPQSLPLTTKLIDVMEPIVDDKFYLTQKKLESIVFTDKMNDTISDNAIGYHLGSRELKSSGFRTDTVGTLTARDYKDPRILVQKVANLDFIKFNFSRGVYSPNGIAPTLQCCGGGNTEVKVIQNIYYTPYGRENRIYSAEGVALTLPTSDGQNPCYGIPIKSNTKQGYMLGNIGDGCYICTGNKRGTVQKYKVPTLTTNCDIGVIIKDTVPYLVRKLTPREYWRLMGFTDDQFNKVAKSEGGTISNSQLYKQAGNSIIVDINMHIVKELIKQDFLGNQNQKVIESDELSQEFDFSKYDKDLNVYSDDLLFYFIRGVKNEYY